jgi:hypothetical protein
MWRSAPRHLHSCLRRPEGGRQSFCASPWEPEDVIKAIAFGLRFESGRRVWQADEYMAVITAKRLIEHLTLDGFVVLKLPPVGGHSALGRGSER